MYCYNCGEEIDEKAVICVHCGCQTHNFDGNKQTITINNDVSNSNSTEVQTSDIGSGLMATLGIWFAGFGHSGQKNKWVSILLCFFFGCIGLHKFYEGKIISGIVYIFAFFGLFGILPLIDFIRLLFKPNPYHV